MIRKYSVAEIDRMRAALKKRHWIQDIMQGEDIWMMDARHLRHDNYIENLLRTYMENGTEPEELEHD